MEEQKMISDIPANENNQYEDDFNKIIQNEELYHDLSDVYIQSVLNQEQQELAQTMSKYQGNPQIQCYYQSKIDFIDYRISQIFELKQKNQDMNQNLQSNIEQQSLLLNELKELELQESDDYSRVQQRLQLLQIELGNITQLKIEENYQSPLKKIKSLQKHEHSDRDTQNDEGEIQYIQQDLVSNRSLYYNIKDYQFKIKKQPSFEIVRDIRQKAEINQGLWGVKVNLSKTAEKLLESEYSESMNNESEQVDSMKMENEYDYDLLLDRLEVYKSAIKFLLDVSINSLFYNYYSQNDLNSKAKLYQLDRIKKIKYSSLFIILT